MDLQTIFAEHRTRNIFFAFLAWLAAFVTYTLTVAPTASFWDPAEYIAISHTLQVAHPPGSPFFALVGRVVSMFIPTEYVALSINMISVTASAFTIMLLYLVIIYLIEEFRGPVDNMSRYDQISTYGGALFGAITFMFTHTHWFNAVEAEMYASSMFFTALVVWIALRWSANYDKPYAERWLILIAFLFGVGIGVHLLNLLAIFFVAMIVYFKLYEFSIKTFVVMAASAVAIFLSIYPITIIWIPNLADDLPNMTYGLIGPFTYIIFIVAALIFGLWYTHKKGMRILNIAVICYTMIIIGYSSYAMVIIRSQADPPIDENDPSTLAEFVKYLSRDQYGDTPLLTGYTFDNRTGNIDRSEESLFPRRYSSQPRHLEYYGNFDSDWQFFWKYQVNHMYLRYFNWNFIGREADIQDTGWYSGFSETRHKDNPANSYYFYLPFLFGLLGLLWHFRYDWRRGLSVMALFILTGLAIIFYLNQTPFQPRERDYAYVGSFFAYAIWVGMGASALLEILKQSLSNNRFATYGTLAVMFAAVPVWMGYQNYPSHDRSNNYVARDYAYNLLNSVEPYAMIFTNGDNDTFPLWYLQEVEGVRTDVRVVNLSLLNTDWYILQMRDRQTHESLPLPISLSDSEIEEITSRLEPHNPGNIRIPVDKEFLNRVFEYGIDDFDPEELSPMMRNQVMSAVPFSVPVEELDDEMVLYLEGRYAGQDGQGNERYYLQAQDILVIELLRQNQWVRPIYFANTVSSDGQLGLQEFFQFEGKAFRVVPKQRRSGQFGYIDPEVHKERLRNFRFEEWNNPNVYFDENIRRMLSNYRYGFTQLADIYIRNGEYEEASYWLRYGEDHIPFREVENDWTIPSLYAYRYLKAQDDERAVKLSEFIEDKLLHELKWDMREFEKIEDRIDDLQQRAERARNNARMDRFQRLRNRANREQQNRQRQMSEVSSNVFLLAILQNVYFETGNEELALDLAIDVDLVTNGRLPFPTTLEESREEIGRFNLGI